MKIEKWVKDGAEMHITAVNTEKTVVSATIFAYFLIFVSVYNCAYNVSTNKVKNRMSGARSKLLHCILYDSSVQSKVSRMILIQVEYFIQIYTEHVSLNGSKQLFHTKNTFVHPFKRGFTWWYKRGVVVLKFMENMEVTNSPNS